MDSSNSASIIDLGAYRVRRRERQAAAQTVPQQGERNPFVGGAAPQFVWFWPVWVWMPMGFAMSPAARWNAS